MHLSQCQDSPSDRLEVVQRSSALIDDSPTRPDASSHSVINPAILYWGTPVVLITTENEDNTINIGPMSSAFWLGDKCVLGLAKYSKTTQNLLRTGRCVLNLPSEDCAEYVNALARTTGSDPVPERKIKLGYSHVKDKFRLAGLTAQGTMIKECPVHMEAEFIDKMDMGGAWALQVRMTSVHVVDSIRLKGYSNRIDPDLWKPLIMSFQKLYGLSGQVVESRLAKIDEDLYKSA